MVRTTPKTWWQHASPAVYLFVSICEYWPGVASEMATERRYASRLRYRISSGSLPSHCYPLHTHASAQLSSPYVRPVPRVQTVYNLELGPGKVRHTDFWNRLLPKHDRAARLDHAPECACWQPMSRGDGKYTATISPTRRCWNSTTPTITLRKP